MNDKLSELKNEERVFYGGQWFTRLNKEIEDKLNANVKKYLEATPEKRKEIQDEIRKEFNE